MPKTIAAITAAQQNNTTAIAIPNKIISIKCIPPLKLIFIKEVVDVSNISIE